MRRTVLIVTLAAVALAALVASGCSASGVKSAGKTDPLKLDTSANGSLVELVEGQQLIVSLPGNPSTGYSWGIVALPSELATVGGATFSSASQATSPAVVGAGGTMSLTFRATTAGAGDLKLEYRRPWETTAAPKATYGLSIEVQ